MLWRKGKGDAAAVVKRQLQQHRGGAPHSGPHTHSLSDGSSVHSTEALSQEYAQADMRATTSVYILCRVLMAIFEQSSRQALTPDTVVKLEDIVFTQLRDAEPSQLLSSSLRLANWRIFGQVLGHMSRLDFDSVTIKFTRQIDTWQSDVTKSSPDHQKLGTWSRRSSCCCSR